MINLQDPVGRKIDYLRVSITDRCNLRCQYCMPSTGVPKKSHDSILRYEEIIQIVSVAIELGIKKVRITGGEPLIRWGVIDFIKMLASLTELEDISMTTNGLLLARYATALKEAGLTRVNISLDSLDEEKYQVITRRDGLTSVWTGIQTALEVGFEPVKLNVVVMRGVNQSEILDFVALAKAYPLHVRFIEFMPMGLARTVQPEKFMSVSEIKKSIDQEIKLIPTKLISNGPANNYKLHSGRGTIGFITPLSHSFCARCNRLRLTADGKLRPCLVSDLEIDLHDRPGHLGSQDFIRSRFLEAIKNKPKHHNFGQQREDKFVRNMFQIGG